MALAFVRFGNECEVRSERSIRHDSIEEAFMGILAWVMFGLLAGLVVKPLLPGRDLAAFILAPVLGVKGTVLGGCLGAILEYGDIATLDWRSLLLAFAGGLVFLVGYRACVGPEWRKLLFGHSREAWDMVSIPTILLIILILLLIGAVPAWPHSRQWGYYPSGGLGLVVVVLLVLLLARVI
jgi:uncharacterized membrane protein YeaQ/YmgE (transglycosylase-associated protein family)